MYGQLEEGALVYVHSAICETSLVVVLFHTSMVNWRGVYLPSVYVHFCYMLHSLGVVVFHRCMVNWRWGPWYMCILLYVKLLWCSSIQYMYSQLEEGALVYVHSAICETSLV